MENVRTLKVTGKGKLSVKPDRIRLAMEISDTRTSYEELLRLSADIVEKLKDCIESAGFERSELKTTNFNMNTKYENYQDKDRSWKSRFAGYEFHHGLKLEFDAQSELLGKALYALTRTDACPEFRIIYTVKDSEAAKNALLEDAVADAGNKAEVLARAAGVKLGNIMNIDYSWNKLEIEAQPMRMMKNAMMASDNAAEQAYNIDIEPADIDVSDNVTVIWEIM